MLERVVGEQHADLVAREHAVAVALRVGNRGGEAVGVGVVGEHQLGARLGGERQHAVHRAGLLGVGKRDRAESAVGVGLRRLGGEPREAGTLEGPHRQPVADAVHRGVGEAQRGLVAAVQRGAREPVEVRLLDSRVARVHERAQARRGRVGGGGPCDLVRARRLGDLPGDGFVHRRDDLAARREVDLVAVVPRRVVAGRHHHAPRGAELRHREGEHRRGHRVGEEAHRDAEAGEHGRGVLGEAAARVASVESDDDAPRARAGRVGLEELRAEAPAGLDHHEPVHPREPRLDAPAQPRGSEHERAGESGRRGPSARSRRRPQRASAARRARRASPGRGPRRETRARGRRGRSSAPF